MIKLVIKTVCLTFLCLASASVLASQWSNVRINGQLLSHQQLNILELQIGSKILPGNYLVNSQTGCWANLTNGQNGCMQSNIIYNSRYGSGERNSSGDWSHWSNAAGGAVGGSGDGCVYAFNWSNC